MALNLRSPWPFPSLVLQHLFSFWIDEKSTRVNWPRTVRCLCSVCAFVQNVSSITSTGWGGGISSDKIFKIWTELKQFTLSIQYRFYWNNWAKDFHSRESLEIFYTVNLLKAGPRRKTRDRMIWVQRVPCHVVALLDKTHYNDYLCWCYWFRTSSKFTMEEVIQKNLERG